MITPRYFRVCITKYRNVVTKCLRLIAISSLLLAGNSFAQEIDDEQTFNGLAIDALQSVVLDRMIIPGVGVSSASVGFEFSAVERGLGQPDETGTTGVLKKTLEWRYQLDDGTVLVVSGKDNVDFIHLIGSPRSAFMTSEGVTFGMNAARVASVYGPLGVVDDETISYNSLGIAFRFDNDALAEIRVSKPGQ